MSYIPHIDEGACAAHGDCAVVAPDVFRIGEVAEVIGAGTPETVLAAAEACPAGAIILVDQDIGEQIHP